MIYTHVVAEINGFIEDFHFEKYNIKPSKTRLVLHHFIICNVLLYMIKK